MKVKLLVYRINNTEKMNDESNSDLLLHYKLSIHKPSIFRLNKIGQSFFVNLYWFIISLGKFEILQLFDSQNIVHYTYITPKVYRFPFMNKKDIQIGPCFTYENYQKRGIYTFVLQFIISHYCQDSRSLWIYCNEKNDASRKTIEKVGFKKCGFASINKFTKVIQLLK